MYIFYPKAEKTTVFDTMLVDHPCVVCNNPKSYGVNRQTQMPYCEDCNYILADIMITWGYIDKREREKDRSDCIYLNSMKKCWRVQGKCKYGHSRCNYKKE